MIARVQRVQVDPANLLAGAAGNNDIAVADVKQGETVIAIPPTDLEAGLVPQACSVPADGQVRIRLYNPSAAAVDGAAKDWTLVIFKEG